MAGAGKRALRAAILTAAASYRVRRDRPSYGCAFKVGKAAVGAAYRRTGARATRLLPKLRPKVGRELRAYLRPRAIAVDGEARPMSGFSGFPAGTATFLQGITENNEKAWFDAHRDDYQSRLCRAGPRLRRGDRAAAAGDFAGRDLRAEGQRLALPHQSRRSLLQGQAALQGPHRPLVLARRPSRLGLLRASSSACSPTG